MYLTNNDETTLLPPVDIRALQRRRLEHPLGAGGLQEPPGLGLLVTVAAAGGPAVEHPLGEVPDLRREHPPEEQRPVPQRHGEVAPATADGVHDGLRAPLRAHHW